MNDVPLMYRCRVCQWWGASQGLETMRCQNEASPVWFVPVPGDFGCVLAEPVGQEIDDDPQSYRNRRAHVVAAAAGVVTRPFTTRDLLEVGRARWAARPRMWPINPRRRATPASAISTGGARGSASEPGRATSDGHVGGCRE